MGSQETELVYAGVALDPIHEYCIKDKLTTQIIQNATHENATTKSAKALCY